MIPEQDFERLSAYLDNQLPAAETSALERRLAREPELKAALGDLRLQARALRDLPRLKPPRNFTLTEAKARTLRRPSAFAALFPALRLATSLSAAAFAVVLGFSVFGAPLAVAPEQPQAQVALAPEEPTTADAAAGGAGEAGTEGLPSLGPAPQGTPEPGGASIESFSTDAGAGTPPVEPLTVTGIQTGTSPAEAATPSEQFRSAAAPAESATPEPAADAALAPPAESESTGLAGGRDVLAPTGLQAWALSLGLLTLALAALTWWAGRR
jgi:hypothetical protein